MSMNAKDFLAAEVGEPGAPEPAESREPATPTEGPNGEDYREHLLSREEFAALEGLGPDLSAKVRGRLSHLSKLNRSSEEARGELASRLERLETVAMSGGMSRNGNGAPAAPANPLHDQAQYTTDKLDDFVDLAGQTLAAHAANPTDEGLAAQAQKIDRGLVKQARAELRRRAALDVVDGRVRPLEERNNTSDLSQAIISRVAARVGPQNALPGSPVSKEAQRILPGMIAEYGIDPTNAQAVGMVTELAFERALGSVENRGGPGPRRLQRRPESLLAGDVVGDDVASNEERIASLYRRGDSEAANDLEIDQAVGAMKKIFGLR